MEVKVMQVQDGIEVINICDLLEAFFGEAAFKWNGPSYKETSAKVREWVAEKDAYYYSDVKEDFFIWKGVSEAKAAGKKIVVVENLS